MVDLARQGRSLAASIDEEESSIQESCCMYTRRETSLGVGLKTSGTEVLNPSENEERRRANEEVPAGSHWETAVYVQQRSVAHHSLMQQLLLRMHACKLLRDTQKSLLLRKRQRSENKPLRTVSKEQV